MQEPNPEIAAGWPPFATGDKVTIFILGLFRQPQIEGDAEIVAPHDGIPGLYHVRFVDEPQRIRERFVFGGDWQADPDKTLQALQAYWRATLTPELLAEFFPDAR